LPEDDIGEPGNRSTDEIARSKAGALERHYELANVNAIEPVPGGFIPLTSVPSTWSKTMGLCRRS
jgi:hypothetical protein